MAEFGTSHRKEVRKSIWGMTEQIIFYKDGHNIAFFPTT